MTLFIAIAALLSAGTALLVARSLSRPAPAAAIEADALNAAVYRDQLAELEAALADGSLSAERHAEARDGIRARLAAELSHAPRASAATPRAWSWGAAACVVLVAAGLYAWRGTPAGLDAKVAAAPAAQDNAHALEGQQMAGMVERLAARLKANPDDVNGWVMLARSYAAMGRFGDAATAYGEAARRSPADAGLLADQADLLAMAKGRRFDDETDAIIARALAADPNHVKALALAGSTAFAKGDYRLAVEHWERLRARVGPESDMARSIASSIAQARERGGLVADSRPAAAAAKPAPAAAAKPAPAAPAKAARVGGVITVAPALAARIRPGDQIMVYARAVDGSRMPLAIARGPVGPFPAVFGLDDSLAMSPAAKLSGARQVVVEARISRSGSAAPAPGDLRGSSGPVDVGRTDLRIEIGTVVE